jgi:transketolase C-terminal domain/subunit
MLHVHGAEASEIALIGGCGALDLAVEATELLKQSGIAASVWSSPFIAPFDYAALEDICKTATLVISVEEHSVVGGLASRCAQGIASSHSRRTRHVGIGIPPMPAHHVGDQRFMRERVGLTSARVFDAAIEHSRIASACSNG